MLEPAIFDVKRPKVLTVLRPDFVKLDEPFVAGCHLCPERQSAIARLVEPAARPGCRSRGRTR
jgi:EAL domain-containing protein (putative c-di-GMP-specific phosphodiesterase class I)